MLDTPVLINQNCPWQPMENLFGSANIKWCEERLCAWVNEPANAWSNILYVVMGLYLIYQGFKNQRKLSGQFQFVFGCIVYIMGLCSFVYHATNNFLTQIFDFIGMFLYVYMLLCLCLYKLKITNAKTSFYIFTGLVAVSTALVPAAKYIHFPYQIIILFAALGIIILQTKIWLKSKKNYATKYLFFCLSFFVIAVCFSYSDVTRLFCDPTNHFLQGHAIWHLLSAIGVWFSYLLFACQLTENN
jgi:predicted membrane channel-forming protein YqfA (hemolysin III family)